ELEVCSNLEANRQLAQQLQASLPIEFSTHDKPTHAAALLGLDPACAPSIEDRALAPIATSITELLDELLLAAQNSLASGSVRSDAAQLGARHQHCDLMTSLLQTFAGLWPKDTAARMLANLQNSNAHLKVTTDLDALLQHVPYQLESLPTALQAGGEDVWRWLQKLRDLAHDRYLEWLNAPEQRSAHQQFERDIHAVTPNSELGRQQLLREAPARLANAITE